ncbi:hypothetical protein Ahia01_000183400 [Argonauta hians]
MLTKRQDFLTRDFFLPVTVGAIRFMQTKFTKAAQPENNQSKIDLNLLKLASDWDEEGKLSRTGKTRGSDSRVKVCSRDSETISKLVSLILERHPGKISVVMHKLEGFPLPPTLRKQLWTNILLQGANNLSSGSMRQHFRHEFGKKLQSNLKKLQVKFPLKSPIKDLIENTVIETYNRVPCMKWYRSTMYMKEASRVLNALYIYNQSYQPFYVLWLFPLQVAFADLADKNYSIGGEEIYELALLLHRLESKFFPSWSIISVIAENVMETLEEKDPELYKHLNHIATVDAQVNPKECLVNLMEEERALAERLVSKTHRTKRRAPTTKLFLAQPMMFVRQWIGEAFVGKLDLAALLWVWDQLFLQQWNQQIFHDICLVLLVLLRRHFFIASDYLQMKQIFVSQTFHLLLLDIQRAYGALRNGRTSLEDIANLNRNYLDDIVIAAVKCEVTELSSQSIINYSRQTHELALKPATKFCNLFTSSSDQLKRMTTIQISDISLKLDFQQCVLQNYKDNILPKSDKITLTILLQFGNQCIEKKQFQSSQMLYQKTSTITGKLVYNVRVADTFNFAALSLLKYFDNMKSGEYFHLIAIVNYVYDNDYKLNLGWAFIPLTELIYLQDKHFHTNMVAALHPGAVPDIFTHEEYARESPCHEDMFFNYILGYNSEICLTGDINTSDPEVLWLAHQANSLAEGTTEQSLHDKDFCIYVDGLRMLPDNASIVKVLPFVIQPSKSLAFKLEPTFPSLNSQACCPVFPLEDRYIVQKKSGTLPIDSFILFIVFTIDMNTCQLCTLGNALMPLYQQFTDSNDVRSCSGGYQLRLRSGSFDISKSFNSSSLDNLPIVPLVSLLVRILPFIQHPQAAPTYNSQYYQSDQCKPTISEERIFTSFQNHSKFSDSLRSTIHKLQLSDGIKADQTELEILDWCRKKLDTDQNIGQLTVLNLNQCVSYQQNIGLKFNIEKIFNLKAKNIYVQCVTQVVSGTSKRHSTNQKNYFMTKKQDTSCSLHSPSWYDSPVTIHPATCNKTFLLIQTLGVTILSSVQDSQPNGSTRIHLDPAKFICWTALDIFEGKSVRNGYHYLPLLSGKPSREVLQQLSNRSVHSVFKDLQPSCCYGTASLCISIWDGHFEYEELPQKKNYEEMLSVFGYQKEDLQRNKNNEDKEDKLSDLIANNTNSSTENSDKFFEKLNVFEESVTNQLEQLMATSYFTF